MRRALPWILVPLAAVAGFLAGRESGPEVADTPARGSGAAEAEIRPADPPPPAPRARVQEPAGRPTARALADVLAAIPGPPPHDLPGTDATITGRVLDDSGAPVAGVLVRADPDAPREWYGEDEEFEDEPTPPIDVVLARDVAETVDWVRRTLPLRRETRTGADGAFVLSDLRDVPYDVEAHSRAWEIKAVGEDTVRPGGTVSFSAVRLVPVTVDVTGPGGRIPDRAWVYSDNDGDDPLRYAWIAHRLDWTPANRTIHVPRGARSFRARSGGLVSAIVKAEVGDGIHVTLEIGASGSIRVRPEWPEGAPGPELVEFTATRLGEGSTARVEERTVDEPHESIEFDDLLVGRWLVQAALREGRVVAAAEADVRSGVVDVPLRIPPFSAEDGFRVRVLDADGRPPGEGTDVDLDVDVDGDVQVRALTTGPGTWIVLRDAPAAGSEIRLRAELGPVRVRKVVAPGHAGEVLLRMPRTCRLAIEVPAEEDAEDLDLDLLQAEDGVDFMNWSPEWSAEDRMLVWAAVPAGLYEIGAESAEVSGGMRFRVTGDTRVRFVPRPYRAWRVDDADPDALALTWGLAEGDLIVGFDGEEIRDFVHGQALLAAAAVRGETTLTVLRGRRRFSVKADARRLQLGSAGIVLSPAILD